jgi:ketosteroid isomerase-like protein
VTAVPSDVAKGRHQDLLNSRQDISIASLDRPTRYLDGQLAALFEGGKECMATHNLIDVYLRVIKAFNENDAQTIQQQVAPDVKYVFHGQNLVSGVYYGIDGVREIFYKAEELTGGTASFEPIDVLANDTTVMVWGRFRGARNGSDFEINHAYYYRFDEHSRFIEGHTIPADQHLANQFWS